MGRRRKSLIAALFLGLLTMGLGPAALAANPVYGHGCVAAYKPYPVYSSSAGINVMRARAFVDCGEDISFQNCLQWQSSTGWRNVRCNAIGYTASTCQSAWGRIYTCYKDVEKMVSGCIQGTRNYRTRVTYWGTYQGSVTSETYAAWYCSKNV